MKRGFTTGSCAAAASKAAVWMLLKQEEIYDIRIQTPGGILYQTEVFDIHLHSRSVSCCVQKDSGDDPDITDGIKVYSKVQFSAKSDIYIHGGKGVGIVTKPGLDQPVGEAAINHVPREMITMNVQEILNQFQCNQGVDVTISIPNGKQLARRTMNPKLGIIGGLSILGTTGIIEPMSLQAILDTIQTEIHMRKAEGYTILPTAVGHYGLDYLKQQYGLDPNIPVLTSNFIQDTVIMASQNGFHSMLMIGHIGKLVKVAGGIGNTHSKYGDHRMEILYNLSKPYIHDIAFQKKIMSCVVTDAALDILKEYGILQTVMHDMVKAIQRHMESWADMHVEVIVFARKGELASSKYAHERLRELL